METQTVKPYSEFLDSLSAGQTFCYRIVGNPVHYAERPNHPGHYFRAMHATTDQKIEWLARQGERKGFELISFPSVESRIERFSKKETPKGTPSRTTRDRRNPPRPIPTTRPSSRGVGVTLAMSTFEGKLRITDPDALRGALTTGVGKAKAYGCGLMTLSK